MSNVTLRVFASELLTLMKCVEAGILTKGGNQSTFSL